jgi:hypothetical protein
LIAQHVSLVDNDCEWISRAHSCAAASHHRLDARQRGDEVAKARAADFEVAVVAVDLRRRWNTGSLAFAGDDRSRSIGEAS